MGMLGEEPGSFTSRSEFLEKEGVSVHPILVGGRRYYSEWKTVGRLLSAWQPHVVHTHGYRSDVLDASVARRRGIPTVTTVHGFTGNGLKNRFYEWLQRRAFRRFDAVVAVSSGLVAELRGSGVPAEKIHLAQNAWAPGSAFLDRETARTKLGVRSTGPVVGWIGRFTPEKNPCLMVKAFSLVEERSAILVMLGGGPMRGEVRDLATRCGVQNRVLLPGIVPRAYRFLRAFDVLALTSRTEGTPMVLLEAMAAGTPIVTRVVGGVGEMLSSQEASMVHTAEDQAMAEGIRAVLAEPGEASVRALRAQSRFERDFSVGPWVERYCQIYRSLRP
jgi:glycosyltransferase involved in cell wall biosynthesis